MPPNPKKQWTVLVYLAGDNSLDLAGVADLTEMKRVGSTPDVDVVAQFDRRGTARATTRYHLARGTPLERDAVGVLGETDTGDPAVLREFLKWGIKTYPARHYLAVVWNHGNGWDDENVYRLARDELELDVRRRAEVVAPAGPGPARTVSVRRIRTVAGRFRRALFRTPLEEGVRMRGIAYDDNAKDFLDNVELKNVLTSVRRTLGRGIDVLGMDACLMSMAEVAYQLRGSVDYVVGSEETEPSEGWPYDTILRALARRPEMTPAQLAALIVDRYVAFYADDAQVTQSACDLSRSDTLAHAVDVLGEALGEGFATPAVRAAVLQARARAQTYEVQDYVDLYDFCALLAADDGARELRAACRGVIDAVGRFVVRAGYKGRDVAGSHGLSIYFPQKTVSPLYRRNLDFAARTSWLAFLEAYTSNNNRRTAPRERAVAAERVSDVRPAAERGARTVRRRRAPTLSA